MDSSLRRVQRKRRRKILPDGCREVNDPDCPTGLAEELPGYCQPGQKSSDPGIDHPDCQDDDQEKLKSESLQGGGLGTLIDKTKLGRFSIQLE